MKVGNIKLRQEEVEIHASSSGYWTIYLPSFEDDDKPNSHGTFLAGGVDLDKVKRQARQRLRDLSTPIAVPFLTFNAHPTDGNEITYPAIARGIHRRTGEILIWIDDGHRGGSNTTYSRYGNKVLKPDTDPTQIRVYYEKTKKLLAAGKKLREWWDANTFDLNRAVSDATKAQADLLDPNEIGDD